MLIHESWPDDISPTHALPDPMRDRLQGHQQVTDWYLVCLAAAHGGRLATFDGSRARSFVSFAGAMELLRE